MVEYDDRERGKKMRAAAILVLALLFVGCGRSKSDFFHEYSDALEAKNYGRAAEICTEAMKAYPGDRVTHLQNRTDAYLRGGDLAKAEADCAERLEANRFDASAYLDRGWLRQKQKRYAEAAADYATAQGLHPEYAETIKADMKELLAIIDTLPPDQLLQDTKKAMESIPEDVLERAKKN